MDILSQSNTPSNFNTKIIPNDHENIQNEKSTLSEGNQNDDHIFRLNPLLNESLNNLVKRLERTKIPKPPPTKGQSTRKKTKLSNSFPNIFLPPGFDDHKYSSNEKKIQWTNKLNLNLERLKNAFHDTFNLWCDRKRSQSISYSERNANDNLKVTSYDICKNGLGTNIDQTNVGQKNANINDVLSQKPLQKFNYWEPSSLDKIDRQPKLSSENIHNRSEFDDIPSYSTHVYLDGAIIEPISPASPARLIDSITIGNDTRSVLIEPERIILDSELDKSLKPIIRKKGRPKKIQQAIIKTNHEPLVVEEEIITNTKSAKATPTKKRNKSVITSSKEDEIPTNKAEDTLEKSVPESVIKPIKMKRQSSKKKEREEILVVSCNEKSTKDEKKIVRQSRSSKMKVQNVNNPEESIASLENLDEISPKQSPTKRGKRLSRAKLISNEPEVSSKDAEVTLETVVLATPSGETEKQLETNEVSIDSVKDTIIDGLTEANTSETEDRNIKHRKNNSEAKIPSIIVEDEMNWDNDKSALTKKQKQLLISTDESNLDKGSEKTILARKPRKLKRQVKPSDVIEENVSVDDSAVVILTKIVEEPSTTIKSSEFSKNLFESFSTNQNLEFSSNEKLTENSSLMKQIDTDIQKKVLRKLNRQYKASETTVQEIDQNVIPIKEAKTLEGSLARKTEEEVNSVKEQYEVPDNSDLKETVTESSLVDKISRKGSRKGRKPKQETDNIFDTKYELKQTVEVENNSNNNAATVDSLEIVQKTNDEPAKDSQKKTPKYKPGPKSKKLLHKPDELIHETILPTTEVSKTAQKSPKRAPSRQNAKEGCIDNEIILPLSNVGIVDSDTQENEAPLTLDPLDDRDLLKHDLTGSADQSNDIEVLSKSITDSVDTSMLPPRKRYKRLMYFDNTKQMSPKEPDTVTEKADVVDVGENISLDNNFKGEEEVSTKKTVNCRPRLKRKKSIKASDDVVVDITIDTIIPDVNETITEVKDDVVPSKEEIIISEESVEIPSSLKRSKREAAARGFANMVAMSLNNSSQSHESSAEFNKKSSITKSDSMEEIQAEISGNKVFKKPRKSSLATVGNQKTKGKLSRTFEFTDEVEEEVEEILTKKQKMSKERNERKENPPSPGETVISNDSSQDSLKYKKIRTNSFVDCRPIHWFHEVTKCVCRPSVMRDSKLESVDCDTVWDCSDNCLNRLTFTECNSKYCPCGELCTNQSVRKLNWVTGLKVTDIPSKGCGVISTKRIPEGTLVTEYVGEVVTEETFQDRLASIYKDDMHQYCVHLDSNLVIDAYRSGSIARFVNHSCQPNCSMQKWKVNGAYRMCLFATEDIDHDTELTYDYNFCCVNTKTTQICLCGASNCRGFIGGRPSFDDANAGKVREKLFFVFGQMMTKREKLFVIRHSMFLIRNRTLGRSRRLGMRLSKLTHGMKLPSVISEIKRRKGTKNQFLTHMSALNSIKSIRTSLLQNGKENEPLTRAFQLEQVLRDLYNTLLQQKDPLNPLQQLVAPFIHCLQPKKYPEFYSMASVDSVVSLTQVYCRMLNHKYSTMMAFDQDLLQMIQTIEIYAGKQSNIGKCAEQLKPIYKDLKMNAIALYEALTDELVDERDKNKLSSNNLTLITNAVKSLNSSNADGEQNDVSCPPKSKKRKPGPPAGVGSSRGRLERGAEVIKCVCGFLIEAGHVMVQCDRCFVWQHAYCMNVARSSELVDVTRMEPYFCHICLNIPTKSLVREIPRHFVITDETIDSGNTLFWTLLHADTSLLKIDDFVYIPTDDDVTVSSVSSRIIDLSRRTIMRIYSLWKDANGKRWMEGGLFLRPYNEYLKSLSESRSVNCENSNKRKQSTLMNLSTHKWHQQEVVYTDLTKILPLDVCIGRCHVLNNHTFRLGKPLIQNNPSNGSIDDVYLCDWLINKIGEWSEIDPAYMKINMKPYCFERYSDASTSDSGSNEKFLRQYTTEELLKLDQDVMESSGNESVAVKCELNEDEKKSLKKEQFDKLITKLSEFSYDRYRKLSLSPPSSRRSLSDSPVCENVTSKEHDICFLHSSRKQICPKKTVILQFEKDSVESKRKTIASEYSEGSPKLIIVVEEDKVTKIGSVKDPEESSLVDDKSSDIVSSSPKENFEDHSTPCSEIKYGDLLDLLKEAMPCKSKPKPKSKRLLTKGKKKTIIKKNELKPVSEINSVDDNWVPTKSQPNNSDLRRETRSRKSVNDNAPSEQKTVVDDGVELEEIEDDGRKTCFVKLERMKVSKAEKNKQKKAEKSAKINDESISLVTSQSDVMTTLSEDTRDSSARLDTLKSGEVNLNLTVAVDTVPGNDDDAQNPSTSSVSSNNRSKRKKGVPKRIPFDFPYPNVGNVPKPEGTGPILAYDYEVVDLSSGKSSQTDKPDQTTVECQKIESPELLALLPKLPKPNLTTTNETRHVAAANDFSSIENISSN